MKSSDDTIESIKQLFYLFVHGRINTKSFEDEIYDCGDLETTLGSDDYLSLISADYRDLEVVDNVRNLTKTLCEKNWPGFLWEINKCITEINAFLPTIPSELSSEFSYCLINEIQTKNYWRPDLPEGCGYILMASPFPCEDGVYMEYIQTNLNVSAPMSFLIQSTLYSDMVKHIHQHLL